MGVALAGRRRGIWLGVTVVVLAVLGYAVVRAMTAGGGAKTKAAETVAVDRGAVSTEVATTGTLAAAQTRSLSFAVAGTVETVKVRAGTTVTAGQVLATVDDDDARQAVDDAQSALDDAEDALTAAKKSAGATSSTTTSCVAAAAYRVSPSPSPSSSPSPSASARPSRTATVTPTKAPAQGGTGTGTNCSANGGGTTRQGGQNGGGDQILSAQQRVNAAEVTLQEREDALAGATITAPIPGRILSVGGKVGSRVSSGSTFISLADIYDMQITASFPEADADHLAVQQKAVITLADKPGETFAATLVVVDPVGTSDGTLTTFGVVLAFADAPKDLLVGQSAQVRVTTGSRAAVLRVPSTAVHDVAGTSGTVQKNGAEVSVRIGLRGDRYTEITSGLVEGDPVSRSW
ncbi:macrolide transporter [Actinoplanes sp. SE50]|uniref:efflux RND transporter periplasmic adaptor subunit n=1 Tax=unclassified Actinoplanes TaxID=2626549 RepID=UPI00023ED036|nr:MULTISPECIES: efflux RND transporter periplasmic adaptor subunit [unclassified Actinoplanes]AEV83828.1 putative macrolide-specific efflux protein macA [Actinoplanes sp. SE50/110]ATO82028.1 macrolide transporter [Actinoplanes sp. SE50]SLL99436.1 macrolide transporter [Actinoplanes sp. SE50/110]